MQTLKTRGNLRTVTLRNDCRDPCCAMEKRLLGTYVVIRERKLANSQRLVVERAYVVLLRVVALLVNVTEIFNRRAVLFKIEIGRDASFVD